MGCEVCGRRITGNPHKVKIERVKMIVCDRCAALGSSYREAQFQRPLKNSCRLAPKVRGKKAPKRIAEALELVDDVGLRVRQTREKLGLSQEDLGRMIRERVSMLRKIETGKMTPNYRLAGKLQHALKVNLLVPPSETKPAATSWPIPHKTTLREVVYLKKKKPKASEEAVNGTTI